MPPGTPVATYSVRTSMTQHSTLWGGDKSDVMNHRGSRLHGGWGQVGGGKKGEREGDRERSLSQSQAKRLG